MSDYKLSYLPLFYDDLMKQVNYIADKLANPKAANDLVDDVEKAILDRLPNAESFEQYPTTRKRRYPYYAIYVGEHVIYYVVIDHKIMEVRRILHVRRDRHKILNNRDF